MTLQNQKLMFTPKLKTSTQTIVKILKLGIRLINLNLACGSLDQNLQLNNNINEAIEILQNDEEFNIPVTKICSIRGRVPRVGRIRNDCNWKVQYGDLLILTSDSNYETCSRAEVCYVSNFYHLKLLQINDEICIDEIALKIVKKKECYITCLVLEPGILKSYQRVKIPYSPNFLGESTPEEINDCKFAIEHKFDFIIAPDVRKTEYYHTLRKLVKRTKCKLIAKIESAIEENELDKIQKHFFALYIDSNKANIDNIAKRAKELQRPLITSFPKQRCLSHLQIRLFEVCDCFNFVSDNSHMVVKILKKLKGIKQKIEKYEKFNQIEVTNEEESTELSQVIRKTGACITYTGKSVRETLSQEQFHHLIVLTKNEDVAKKLNLWRLTIPMIYVDCEMKKPEDQFDEMIKIAMKYGHETNILKDAHPKNLTHHLHYSGFDNSCTILNSN